MRCSGKCGFAREWACGAFLSMFALGPGLLTGRETAFFYAQTGRCSWLGIVLCAALFGLFTGTTARCAARYGAENFPQIFRRAMGIYAGGVVKALHALALAGAACLALCAFGRYAALVLPFRNGGLAGMLAGTMLSALICAKGGTLRLGAATAVSAVVLMLGLVLHGRTPAAAQMYGYVKLKLEGSLRAALFLGLLHGCRGMAVTAGAAAKYGRKLHPLRLGLAAGSWQLILLGLGNYVLLGQAEGVLALAEPFAAMCGEWGKAGYFSAAGMLWAGALPMMSGVMLSARALVQKEARNGC